MGKLCRAGVIALLFWLQPTKYEYQKPLGDSFLFYEAHRSGVVLAARSCISALPWCSWGGVGVTGHRLCAMNLQS